MDSPIAERKYRPDPYDIYQENMERLKVVKMMNTSSHSAPNSPMLQRGRSDTQLGNKQQQKQLLSPLPVRKPVNVEEGTFSRSLTELPRGRNRSLSPSPHGRHRSPGQSPIGSPGGVSDRIIRAHYLANTTGKPGSYMLKKSEEIVKLKGSPHGSMQMLVSPSVERKNLSPGMPRKLPPLDIDPIEKLLSTPARPATIVISPATEEPVIGFSTENVETKQTKNSPRLQQETNHFGGTTQLIPKKSEKAVPKVAARSSPEPKSVTQHSTVKTNREEEYDEEGEDLTTYHLTHVRKGAGKARAKDQTHSRDCHGQTKGVEPSNKNGEAKSSLGSQLEKKHRYMKYGDTGRDPALLTPPKEPRGSRDLSAELEKIFREKKGRKIFDDLEHVEEHSISASEGDHENEEVFNEGGDSEDEENDNRVKKPAVAFTMPPVFESIPTQLQTRDYEAPEFPIDTDIDPEEWERIKKCRYIRKGNNDESDEEGNEPDDIDEMSSDTDEEQKETPT